MDFIGGRGLGIYYLYHELDAGTDPLSEKNKLIILNGVLARQFRDGWYIQKAL